MFLFRYVSISDKLLNFVLMGRKIFRIDEIVKTMPDMTFKLLAERLKKQPLTITRWNSGETMPDAESIYMMAEILGVDLRELFITTKPDRIALTVDERTEIKLLLEQLNHMLE